MGLFVFSLLFIGSQAHASVLSDALLQIQSLKNEILLLKSSLKASVAGSSVDMPPNNLTDLTVAYLNVTPNDRQVKIEANIINDSDYSTVKSFTNRFEIYSESNGRGSMIYNYNYSLNALADDTDIKIDHTFFYLTNGKYSARVCADINSEIVEANESNNCSVWKDFEIVENVVFPIGTYTTDLTPRISVWQGKVNQHVDVDSSTWQTDADGRSGAELDKLTYCKKFYPNTTSVKEYKNETINSWHAAGNTGNYTSIKMSYECVHENTTPSITVLSPNGGESYKVGEKINISLSGGLYMARVGLVFPDFNPNSKISDGNDVHWLSLTSNAGRNFIWDGSSFVDNNGNKNYWTSGTGNYKIVAIRDVKENKCYLNKISDCVFDLSDNYFTITSSDTKPCQIGCTCDSNGNTISCPVTGAYANWTEKTISNFDINTANPRITSSVDGKKIFAVGEYSRYIYKSKDGGETWTTQTNVGQYDGSGRVFEYSDGSKAGWEIRGWYSVALSSDGNKIALLGHAGTGNLSKDTMSYVYTSTDSGDTWTEHSTPDKTHFYLITSSSDGSKLFAADYNGYIYKSTDGAVSWVKQNSGQRNWSSLTSIPDGSTLFATDRGTGYFDGSVYKSIDSGANWVKLNAPSLMNFNGIASSSDGKKLVLVGSCKSYMDCHIYTSTDGGNKWTAQKNDFPGNSQYYTYVTSSPDGTKLAAVGWTNVYLSTDSGVTWTAQNNMDMIFTSIVMFKDNSEFIVGNVNSRIFKGKLSNSMSDSSKYTTNNSSKLPGYNDYVSNNSYSSNVSLLESVDISRTLKLTTPRMIGDDVKTLQNFLGIKTDGSFGPMTKAKVMEWQRANGLTPDGAFGPASRQKAGL